jgi:hypothetical protein
MRPDRIAKGDEKLRLAQAIGDWLSGWHRATASEPRRPARLLRRLAESTLHSRNPYSPEDPTIDIHCSVEEWLAHIKKLLSWHFVHLVDSLELWVVQVPNEGPVRAVGVIADRPSVVMP